MLLIRNVQAIWISSVSDSKIKWNVELFQKTRRIYDSSEIVDNFAEFFRRLLMDQMIRKEVLKRSDAINDSENGGTCITRLDLHTMILNRYIVMTMTV